MFTNKYYSKNRSKSSAALEVHMRPTVRSLPTVAIDRYCLLTFAFTEKPRNDILPLCIVPTHHGDLTSQGFVEGA